MTLVRFRVDPQRVKQRFSASQRGEYFGLAVSETVQRAIGRLASRRATLRFRTIVSIGVATNADIQKGRFSLSP
jgi:hypothetical protein